MTGSGSVAPAGRESTSRCTRSRFGNDQGSATIWLLAVGLLLISAAAAGTMVGAAHLARQQAQTAADLGALAGAAQASWGAAAACDRAAELALANRARLTGCELVGLDLTITVEVSAGPSVGLGRVATATARAGPVSHR